MTQTTIAALKVRQENCVLEAKTLENPLSLRFRKITTFEILMEKESEFPKHHFEFIAYNPLQSKVPYRDENNKMIYPILTEAASTDVQLEATPATYYYINPQIPKAENAYTIHHFHYPEQEKTRNRQTVQTLLEQDPTTFKGVRFTCEAVVTSVNNNRSWSYPSCSKASTKRNGIYTCEDHEK
uniref:Nucleic acid-binding, OB-fold protein n=1 Tax=Tanacetum cinerariifolium TaxID=118510 RepID=A0A699GNJ6_TANCI|nr:nucleic acid-binding, OB-fold protein [Tanacetum cinerariifolium]